MPVVVVAALIALAVLTAPATVDETADETVVVLPAPDGHIGAVVVRRGSERQVLDQAYAAIRSGEQLVTRLSPEEVQRSFGAALAALPMPPATFLLYFVTGTDELTPESKADLTTVLAALKNRPSPDVLVIGHTDSVGAEGDNDRLSLQRAETAKSFLIEIGIPAPRVRTAGRGKREPLVRKPDNTEEPRNRRVEINVR